MDTIDIVAINRHGYDCIIFASIFSNIRCLGGKANTHSHNLYFFNDIRPALDSTKLIGHLTMMVSIDNRMGALQLFVRHH